MIIITIIFSLSKQKRWKFKNLFTNSLSPLYHSWRFTYPLTPGVDQGVLCTRERYKYLISCFASVHKSLRVLFFFFPTSRRWILDSSKILHLLWRKIWNTQRSQEDISSSFLYGCRGNVPDLDQSNTRGKILNMKQWNAKCPFKQYL